MPEIDAQFWAQVWRCPHAVPCTRCCWPWKPALRYALAHQLLPRYGLFVVRVPPPRMAVLAHRMALAVTQHALLLPFGHHLHACHHCDFPSCCNPWHLFVGTPRENVTGTVARGWSYTRRRPVRLPDGTAFAPWLTLHALPCGMPCG